MINYVHEAGREFCLAFIDMFPVTKNSKFCFRYVPTHEEKAKNVIGYVPCYEQGIYPGWNVIHTIFSSHMEVVSMLRKMRN